MKMDKSSAVDSSATIAVIIAKVVENVVASFSWVDSMANIRV